MTAMAVKLERVSGGGSLRSDAVEGWCSLLPEPGEQFVMTAPPKIEGAGDIRIVTTSPVRSVQGLAPLYVFVTATGSVYQLTVKQ